LKQKKNRYAELTDLWLAESHKSADRVKRTMAIYAALSYYAIYSQYEFMQATSYDEW